jgi:predicted RND superfamily exporter protein
LLAAAAGARLRRGALLGAFAAFAVLAALAGAALGSARSGLFAGSPSAMAALVAFGALGQLGLPLDSLSASLGAFAALAGAAPALLYLMRVRALRSAGAERGVAVSVALRDAGRPIAAGALAGLTFLGLLASAFPPVRWFGALAAFEVLAATGLCLVMLPALARRFPV